MSACAIWDVTHPATGLGPAIVIEALQQIAKKWVFQKEKGEETGYEHYQIRFSLRKKAVWGTVKANLTTIGLTAAYITPSSTASTHGQAVFSYVQKLDTRIQGPWSDKDHAPPPFIGWQYEGLDKTLLPWQKTVWENIGVRDRRTVNCVVDPRGDRGKSILSNLMRLHGDAVMIPPVNDFQLLVSTTCDILMATENRNPKVIFIDLPRATPKKHLSAMYSAVEQIKSGHVFDLRYHYKSWDFHAAQIWVFTNKYPDMDLLSSTRWKIWNITDSAELVPGSSSDDVQSVQ